MSDDSWDAGGRAAVGLSDTSMNSSMKLFLDEMRRHSDAAPRDEIESFGAIGRFLILDVLGRGTFGVVLLAHDPFLDCNRALKVPTEAALKDARLRVEFLKEARFAAAIDHPNVVRFYEADELAGYCYLVMEYCPEGSLKAWLDGRSGGPPTPERWAARLVSQLADGVHHAHLKGILHRDIKPGNVLLVRVGTDEVADPPEFTPKVADFGLAKLLESEAEGLSVDGSPIGTYAYMSPEQARGRRKEIGPRSDVYGLGAILFEVLAGARAYPQTKREDVLNAILGDEPSPSLSQRRPGVSRELEIICRTCLEKDPRDRYPTALALAEDLRRFDRGEAVKGAPWWKKARSFARKHSRSLAVAVVLAALLVLGGASWEYVKFRKDAEARLWLRSVEAADIASLPARVAEHDPDDPRVKPTLRALFESPVAGKKLAAAVMLVASDDPRCASYAYDRLLGAEPAEIAPLIVALNGRMPGLVDRLRADALAITKATGADEAERLDRRRGKAGTALILMGHAEAGLDILIFTPQPQARSFLIHTLGPANAPPDVLFKALETTPDDSIRRSLLQALGEVPESRWTADRGLHAKIVAEAKRLYVEDPDPGVHGSAKWLLLKWGFREDLNKIDVPLRGEVPGREFGWRISETGLTMVIVRHPSFPRPIEVSDCEISVADYFRLVPEHKYNKQISPDPEDSPMNTVDYNRSAAFCNALTARERAGDPAYTPVRDGPIDFFLQAKNPPDPSGYRLPTDREFEILCRAGVQSRCFYGASMDLMKHYAVMSAKLPRLSRASLKPNDLGLFDTLGNVGEWARSTAPEVDPLNLATTCGCSFHSNPLYVSCGQHTVPPAHISISLQNQGAIYNGFRVVRTLKTPDDPPKLEAP